MSEFDDIQRLIRLKRFEQPSEDFVDDFVRSFQHRQREELLKASARELLWERVATYFDGLSAPKWGWAAAALMAACLGWLSVKPAGRPPETLVQTGGSAAKVQPVVDGMQPITDEEVRQYLLGQHYGRSVADENHQRMRWSSEGSSQFAVPSLPVYGGGELLPAGFKLEVP